MGCRGEGRSPIASAEKVSADTAEAIRPRTTCAPRTPSSHGRTQSSQFKRFFTAHDDVQGLAIQQHIVFQSVQLGHGRNQRWVLALDPDLLFDAHFVVAEAEDAIGFVVEWWARATESDCQPVAQAEARVAVVAGCALGLQGAYLEQQGGIGDGEMKGDIGRERRIEDVLVDGALPPLRVRFGLSLERLASFLDVVV